jgi:hypothetical protein
MDGARLMVGKRRGFIAHVKATAPECTSNHFQALAVNSNLSVLKTVFYEAG